MGKKRAQKDRGYLTYKEHAEGPGGFKGPAGSGSRPPTRLPFGRCALTFTPFSDPVAAPDGSVFDVLAVVPYVRQHGRHPVTGEPLALADLVPLNVHKNADGEYACPVSGKVFTDHTRIVAIRTTGNVFAADVVEQLNAAPKHWRDLVSDAPFAGRADILTLQDPLGDAAARRGAGGGGVAAFDHVQRGLAEAEAAAAAGGGADREGAELRAAPSRDMARALGALGTDEAAAALRAGGGGARAEAKRLLAEAAVARRKGGGGQAAGGTGAAAGGAAAAGAAAATSGGKDWRLTGPGGRQAPTFKPGAVTWNTDDRGEAEQQQGGKKQSQQQQQAKGGKDAQQQQQLDPNGGRQNPKQWYDAQGFSTYVEGHATTGATAAAFTSTTAAAATKSQRVLTRVNRSVSGKGYARLHTTLGDLNLELHCDLAPRACENWLGLAAMGYYAGTAFHRSIKNFMVQGGDPTGTGLGGESIYGPTFRDEFDSRLTHAGRGVLSMANSGPHTNGSQFFVLFKSARHLDNKHTVFGRVVGGLEVLSLIERVPTDSDDRPLQEVRITGVTVFTNPFLEPSEGPAAAAAAAGGKGPAAAAKQQQQGAGAGAGGAVAAPNKWQKQAALQQQLQAAPAPALPPLPVARHDGVGRYMPPPAAAAAAGTPGSSGGAGAAAATGAPPAAKRQKQQEASVFDAW